ncbi:tRNA (adenosine(37)-N6)-dimethylallyltransferase MiaA [Ramlibacter sp. XY19]|uniref:tRNA (adenosine(37)-N6)-dimethylallyltransferase MiaA n=1 Tax=Ramlibacter paludis TaxID=2908000 RepID=UPI0023DB0FB8|nr:tRNA (adenosine(37)-N6)-dimethylallyltransferase MiaA [Ramlibacter paludis]MCG2593949.1 tRNA (adenosine(37)-N6)-dimethylallyltransferase MiaA [Ramlibacter paludis]
MPAALPATIALAGPTASGKTAAALRLAQALAAEIISVDSALVYRGMDIGTAKPSAQEQALVPHHLLDIRDPAQAYSAAEFATDAQRLVAQIRARGRRVLLVGGTMLYFKALFEGLSALPAADAEVREAISNEATTAGWPAMHAQLAQVDAATAARLAPNDAQRIQRALEVFRVSGMPMSQWHAQAEAATPEFKPDLFLSLEPADRGWLHERIAQRFDAMLAAGFLDEVRALRARGDLHPGLPSIRCVGYRQAWEALDSGEPLASLRERGIAATRQLAKRQLTWLRGMEQRRVIACDAPDALQQVLAAAGVPA